MNKSNTIQYQTNMWVKGLYNPIPNQRSLESKLQSSHYDLCLPVFPGVGSSFS